MAAWKGMTPQDQAEARPLKITGVKPSHTEKKFNIPSDVGRGNPEMGELVIIIGSWGSTSLISLRIQR